MHGPEAHPCLLSLSGPTSRYANSALSEMITGIKKDLRDEVIQIAVWGPSWARGARDVKNVGCCKCFGKKLERCMKKDSGESRNLPRNRYNGTGDPVADDVEWMPGKREPKRDKKTNVKIDNLPSSIRTKLR